MSASVYKSLGVHAAIALVLLISVSFSHDPLPATPSNAPIIEATFIDAQAIADAKRAQAQAEAQAKAKEVERQRKIEEEPRHKQKQRKLSAKEK